MGGGGREWRKESGHCLYGRILRRFHFYPGMKRGVVDLRGVGTKSDKAMVISPYTIYHICRPLSPFLSFHHPPTPTPTSPADPLLPHRTVTQGRRRLVPKHLVNTSSHSHSHSHSNPKTSPFSTSIHSWGISARDEISAWRD